MGLLEVKAKQRPSLSISRQSPKVDVAINAAAAYPLGASRTSSTHASSAVLLTDCKKHLRKNRLNVGSMSRPPMRDEELWLRLGASRQGMSPVTTTYSEPLPVPATSRVCLVVMYFKARYRPKPVPLLATVIVFEYPLCHEKTGAPGTRPKTVTEFNGLPKWKQAKILQALKEWVPTRQYNFPHAEVSALDVHGDIAWHTCVGAQKSASGSEGIIFVEFPDKKALCIKSPVNSVAEMFGTTTCEFFEIRCPKMRAVQRDSGEGMEICKHLIALGCDNQEDCQNKQSVKDMLEKPILLVIEYLSANELAMNWPATGSIEWCKSAFGLPGDSINEHGRGVLEFMGELVAFDLVIKNNDRFPSVVWDYPPACNPGNIMFDTKSGDAISIDNMPVCISSKNGDMIDAYLKRVARLTSEVAADPDKEHANFRLIRDLLFTGCPRGHGWLGLGVDIGEEGSKLMQAGFLKAVRKAAGNGTDEDPGLTLDMLTHMREDLFHLLPDELKEDAETTNICGFEFIDLSFLDSVVETFRKALSTKPSGSTDRLEPLQIEAGGTGRKFRIAAKLVLASAKFSMKPEPEQQKELLDELQKERNKLLGTLLFVATRTHRWSSRSQSSLSLRKSTMKSIASIEEQEDEEQEDEEQEDQQQANQGYAAESHGSDDVNAGEKQITYMLDELACLGPWPPGVDSTRREDWLSNEDFENVFKLSRKDFNELKLWKQHHLKKQAKLF